MYHCPECGGQLRYHIETGSMKCEHCETLLPIAEAEKLSPSSAENGMEGYTYTCPNCGGSLFTVDTSAATFCSFCGSSVALTERITHQVRPDRIIPFKITKEQCVQNFFEYLNSTPFVDTALTKNALMESFRAIYIPFCNYRTETHGTLTGEITETRGETEYTYRAMAQVDARNDWQLRDLSVAFPDDHCQRINEFSRADSRPFTPAYLAGFYADVPDVSPETYLEDVLQKNAEEAAQSFYQSVNAQPSAVQQADVEKKALACSCKTGQEIVFLPVWFLSVRSNDRVYYAMVNGATGRVTSDLPINKGKLFMLSCLVAAALFIVLAFLLNLTLKPEIAVAVASVSLVVIACLCGRETRKCLWREGEQDRLKKGDGSATPHKSKLFSGKIRVGRLNYVHITGLAFAFVFFLWVNQLLTREYLCMVAAGASAVAMCICPSFRFKIPALLLECAGLAVLVLRLPYDLLLYGLCVVMLLMGILCEMDMIRVYHRLCSSPIPVFDTHKGGEGDA